MNRTPPVPPSRLTRFRDALRKPFRRQVVETLPVRYKLGRTDNGRHRVRVFVKIGDDWQPVDRPADLTRYGYRHVVETPTQVTTYVLDAADLETLLGLQSMNPMLSPNGALTFDFSPAMLLYLRGQEHVGESNESQRTVISDQPLQPAATVDFDPQSGVTVRTGYRAPGDETIVPGDVVRTTADGRYAWVGDTVHPLPTRFSERAAAWLRRSIHHIPIGEVPEFYVRDLAPLRQEMGAVLTDRMRELRVVEQRFQPVVYLDAGDGGWLNFNVGYQVGGRTYSQAQLAGATDQPYIRLDDKTWARMDRQALRAADEQLRRLAATLTPGGGYRVPAAQFATLEEFVAAIGGESIVSERYRAFIDQLTGFRADETFHLSAAAETHLAAQGIRLRPYQRAGIHWLTWLNDNQLHGLLADDMGLGKTLQSILTLRYAYETTSSRQPSLVIAPASVLTHWERELQRFLPGVRAFRYHGPGRTTRPLLTNEPVIAVSTFDTVRSSIEQLATIPFFYVILDEATAIKNPTSARAKAVKALNAAHRLSLSGTPVENRPAELWSIYDFLMTGHLGPYGTFERVFENPILDGNQEATERLGRRIQPFMLRRLKGEVARDLPEKIEMDEWCELTVEQRALYNEVQAQAQPTINALQTGGRVDYAGSILPILTKLKQVCDHPAIVNKQMEPLADRSQKFDWITARVADIVAGGEQVLIFSHFLGMLDLLGVAMRQRGLPTIRIDGTTNARQDLVDRFNRGRASVGLFSIRAAGHGITVTAANHVIHADRWWNPAVENQATDRVHRIGQTKTVYVYRIMVENTLEERIERLLQRKQNMANQIVGAARQETQQWTREELLEILRPLS